MGRARGERRGPGHGGDVRLVALHVGGAVIGTPKSAEWYDAAYLSDPNLTADADVSTFGPLWREMARRVPDGARVVEIGCGAGQLGAMIAGRCASYFGFDWSPVAAREAKRRLALTRVTAAVGAIDLSAETVVAIASCDDRESWADTTLLACESFEHFDAGLDLQLLAAHPGARVLFSLPTRDSESHVRHFPTEASVRERYEPRVEGMTVERFDQWWIVEGRAR